MKNYLVLLAALFMFTPAAAVEQKVAVERDFGTLYGTLTIPDAGSDTAALIIAGSGPTDRDGNNATGITTDCYKMLAAELEANGIASLRYDKRAIASSVLNDPTLSGGLTLDDYIADAVVLTDWLRDEGFSKVILVGHSEGAKIALCAAHLTPNATAVVSLCGAAYPTDEILRIQLTRQLVPQFMYLQLEAERILASLRRGVEVDVNTISRELRSLFSAYQKFLISDIRIDPQKAMRAITQPVLVIGGEYDIQVTPDNAHTLAAVRPGLKAVIIPRMSHVLKCAESADAAQQAQTVYRDFTSPLAEGLTAAIAGFAKGL